MDTNSIDVYSGNPNYLKLIPDGETFEDITLDDLGLNVKAVKDQLFPMNDEDLSDAQGNPYPDSLYQQILEQCVSQVEKEFDIVIRPRRVVDRVDYHANNFNDYMYVQLQARPILHIEDIKLYYNTQTIYDYDMSWIKAYTRSGQLQIQPSTVMGAFSSGIQSPFMPVINMNNLGTYGNNLTPQQYAPQMIGVTGVYGFIPRPDNEEGIQRDYYIPQELVAYIAKYSAVEVLERWGRTPVGAGIAGYTTSMDGMSTTVQTTASAENSASSGEIRNLLEDMKNLKNSLVAYFGRNINFIV